MPKDQPKRSFWLDRDGHTATATFRKLGNPSYCILFPYVLFSSLLVCFNQAYRFRPLRLNFSTQLRH